MGTFEPRLPGLCLTLGRTMEQHKGETRSPCEWKVLHLFGNLACSVKTLHVLLAFMSSPPSGPAEYFALHLAFFFASRSQASEQIHFSSLLQIKHPSFIESVLPRPATAVRRARTLACTQAGRQAALPLILPSLPLPFNSLSARCDWEYWVEHAGDLHAVAQVTGGGAVASLVR